MYVMNEAAFEVPDLGLDFVDHTAHDLDAPLPGGRTLGLLVVRDPIPPGKGLREVVQEHVLREAKRLRGYRILDDRAATVGGEPAIDVCARWIHDGDELYTREAHVAAGSTRLTFAMTAPLAQRAACDEGLDRVIGTFTFR